MDFLFPFNIFVRFIYFFCSKSRSCLYIKPELSYGLAIEVFRLPSATKTKRRKTTRCKMSGRKKETAGSCKAPNGNEIRAAFSTVFSPQRWGEKKNFWVPPLFSFSFSLRKYHFLLHFLSSNFFLSSFLFVQIQC